MKIKTCRHCGKKFKAKRNIQYCSEECRKEEKRKRQRVTSRWVEEKAVCPICLNEFVKSTPTRIYCSDKCATESRRLRYREAAKKKESTMEQLARIAKEAYDCNMHYGDYVARMPETTK